MANLMTENRPPQITAAHLSRKAVICLPDAASPALPDTSGSSTPPWDPRAAALRWGWAEHMVEVITEAHDRNGSRRDQGTAWLRLYTAVASGSVGIIFVAKLSHLFRSPDAMGALAELFRSHKVLLAVDGLIVDFNDPTDWLMLRIRRDFAEYENRRMIPRTRAKTRDVAGRSSRWDGRSSR